jgi:hypothetical protein
VLRLAVTEKRPATRALAINIARACLILSVPAFAQQTPQFTPGNLVVAVEGCGVYAGTCTNVANGTGTGTGNSSATGYGDNQAAPLTLFQFTPIGTTSATYVNSLVLPQTASGANLPVSGEYGSSSEGTLQLSGSGQYLTIAGYGINAATFNANPTAYGAAPSLALAQSGSLTGQSYNPVARVIALIDSNGTVTSSTAIYNIFNTNNPRSVYTLNGASAYISGQGSGSDATGGVFYTALGSPNPAPTPITGLDTTNNTIAQDTRDVQVVNNTLYVSVDSKGGSGSARSYIGTLGNAGTPPTSTVGAPVMLSGFGNSGGTGKVTITSGSPNTGNGLNAGLQINLSPSNYFFANPATLYVADTGNAKNNSANSTLGDGGLQKWVNSKADGTGTWSLAYTLYKGLNLVANTSGTGTSGLYGLTGTISSGAVQLFATNATLSDLDPTYLFGITDNLSYTTPAQAANETFSQLAAAPSDSNFKGVSFAPTVVTPVSPVITWTAPAAITYGSALSSEQLDATANVAGTFTYTPAAGAVLAAGANQTLSVLFTPNDTTDYTTASATTTITVNAAASPASLVITKTLTRVSGNVVVQLTIANTGGSPASGVTVTSVKVGSTTATPATQAVGTIAAGASAQATFTVPGSVGASGAASSLVVTGTDTAGTFSSSARITLP